MIFSLILPVYNVEKYIERCLMSCCTQQNFKSKDYEIIVVDDSSPDNSIEIARAIFLRYPEINYKIVKRPNGGLSAARNTGLKYANGEYIWFIDSDDYIEEDALKVLYNVITKHPGIEVITFGHRNIYPHKKIDYKPPLILHNHESTGMDLIENTSFYSAWNRIYKRDLILSTGLKFVEGIIWEDGEFNLRLLSITSAHYCIPDILYNYVRRPYSISTSNKITLTLNSNIYKFDSMSKWIKEHVNFSDSDIRILNKRNNEAIIFLLAGLHELPNKERQSYYHELKKRKRVIKKSFLNSSSFLHKLIVLSILYFPKFIASILGYKMRKILNNEKQQFQ